MKTLILGANFGTSLAAEIAASGDKRLISDDGVAQHVTRPLLEVAGVPALEWWLRALRRCPHTSDVSDVHVIANQENATEYVNWTLDENPAKCGGFDRGNVVNDGAAPDGARAGPAGDLLAALENAIGYDDHLLLIDGDHVPEPNFDIGTIIDHAAARGRDTLTYTRGSSASSDALSDAVALRLACGADGAPLSNPEVLGALAYPSDAAAARAAGYTAAAGPVVFLRKETLPWVSRFFEDVGDLEPAHQSLGRLVAYLRGKTSMRAMEMKHVFPLKTLAEYTHADALFRFHAERREEAERAFGGEGVVAGAPSDATTRKRTVDGTVRAGRRAVRKRARARRRGRAGHGRAHGEVRGVAARRGDARRAAPRAGIRRSRTVRGRVAVAGRRARAAPVLRHVQRRELREEDAHAAGDAHQVARRQGGVHGRVRGEHVPRRGIRRRN